VEHYLHLRVERGTSSRLWYHDAMQEGHARRTLSTKPYSFAALQHRCRMLSTLVQTRPEVTGNPVEVSGGAGLQRRRVRILCTIRSTFYDSFRCCGGTAIPARPGRGGPAALGVLDDGHAKPVAVRVGSKDGRSAFPDPAKATQPSKASIAVEDKFDRMKHYFCAQTPNWMARPAMVLTY